jgi:hypothetical protein
MQVYLLVGDRRVVRYGKCNQTGVDSSSIRSVPSSLKPDAGISVNNTRTRCSTVVRDGLRRSS